MFSKKKRSKIMSRIRSTGNRSTELRLRACLVRRGLRGWTVHQSDLPGVPDFVFRRKKVVVFVDGCFWHGCRMCFIAPKSHQEYWAGKISRNVSRDRRISGRLRRQGWRVLRIWEHQIEKCPRKALEKVTAALEKRRERRKSGSLKKSAEALTRPCTRNGRRPTWTGKSRTSQGRGRLSASAGI